MRFVIVFFFLISYIGCSQSLKEIYDKSIEAYAQQNYTQFKELNIEALKIHPSQPTFLLNLARAHALTNEPQEAYKLLHKLISWNVGIDLNKEKDLEEIWNDKKSATRLRASITTYTAPVAQSNPYFEVSSAYHLEDLALLGNNFFLTDIRKGKVLRYNIQKNHVEEWCDLSAAAMAILVDESQKRLWVSSAMLPQYYKYKSEEDNKGKIYEIDAVTGNVITEIILSEKAVVGSMVMHKNEKIYATNSLSPEILIVNTKSKKEEARIEVKGAFNLQGITMDSNTDKIYIADYIKGIVQVDLLNLQDQVWLTSNDYLLKGIDGLNFVNANTLIAIQNNTTPKKVIQIRHSSGNVNEIKLLDNALDHKGEPTNGKYYKNLGLFYIANSAWPAYDKAFILMPNETENQVIRLIKDF